MIGCWIDEGDGANYDKLDRHSITRPYFSLRRHTKADVDHARAEGFEIGGYHASSWALADNPAITGRQYADLVNKLTSVFLGGDGRGIGVQLAINVDIEQHVLPGGFDQWMTDFITRWRAVRAQRETQWSLEPMQGGRLHNIRDMFIQSRMDIVPYTFTGIMEPFDHAAVVRDLVLNGYPINRIKLFYDAGHWYDAMGRDGIIFRQGLLP